VNPDVVNGDDVRVIELTGGARFLLKSSQTIFVLREFDRQDLTATSRPSRSSRAR
jgi:hypothetical protein